jgi:hypothetical protein
MWGEVRRECCVSAAINAGCRRDGRKLVCQKSLWNETTQQSTALNMTVTATAKAMVVRSTKDDKVDVMTTMTTTTLMTRLQQIR